MAPSAHLPPHFPPWAVPQGAPGGCWPASAPLEVCRTLLASGAAPCSFRGVALTVALTVMPQEASEDWGRAAGLCGPGEGSFLELGPSLRPVHPPTPHPKDQARNFRSPHFCCCCWPRRSQEPTLGSRWAEAVPAGREGASTGWPQGQLPSPHRHRVGPGGSGAGSPWRDDGMESGPRAWLAAPGTPGRVQVEKEPPAKCRLRGQKRGAGPRSWAVVLASFLCLCPHSVSMTWTRAS